MLFRGLVSPFVTRHASHMEYATSSPDQLLLELLDLLNQCFPRPIMQGAVHFRPSPDGSRPTLSDLSGTAQPDGPLRPDLGRTEDEIQDQLNLVIGEFAEATSERAGLRVTNGRIEVRVDGQGADAWLVEHNAGVESETKDETIRLQRRFDESELLWLIHTPALYCRLNRTETQEARQAARALELIDGYPRYRIDLAGGAVAMSGDATEERQFKAQLIGTWGFSSEIFRWGWDYEELPEPVRAGIESVRRQATDSGLRALYEAALPCPRVMAERLARHGGAEMNAGAVFCARVQGEEGDGLVFLTLEAMD